MKCYIIENEISGSKRGTKRVLWTLILTIGICLLEFLGGVISKSNALIADAGHMLTDSVSLFVCYFASLLALKRTNSNKTFGYLRIEILASLINGTLLMILAIFVIISAIKRYFEPVEINGNVMFFVSSIGLITNVIAFFLLKGQESNLNIKGALMHIIGDTLSSIGVLGGSAIIIFTGFNLIDSILGLIIGSVVFYNAIRLVKDATDILLESVPSGFDADQILDDIKNNVNGVLNIHDVHIWSISSNIYVFTAHIVTDVESTSASDEIVKEITMLLKKKYNIVHTTLQIESKNLRLCQ